MAIQITSVKNLRRLLIVIAVLTYLQTSRHSQESLVAEQTSVSFSCLDDDVENIRQSRSITTSYVKCKSQLQQLLGTSFSDLDDDALRAVYASLAANRLANFGDSSVLTFNELIAANELDCDNYAVLAGHLIGAEDPALRMIGFHGGAVGNHAQLIYERDNISVLLDPSIGLVARVDFDSLLSGAKVESGALKSFYIAGRAERHYRLDFFEDRTRTAVLNGEYKPSDLLYYFETVADYVPKSRDIKRLPTPGAMKMRRRK
ncbi:MAG: hypothetical protein J5J00_01260 [Deltaproteobacteria bacterium]|nr:hypothetical protein [Deltaproteobacteria bacterium]